MGLNAGYTWARADVNLNVSDPGAGYLLPLEVTAINVNGAGRLKPSGFTGGVTLGYNWQWQNPHGFIGVEGDYDHYNHGASRSVTFLDPCGSGCTYTIRQGIEVRHLATFRVRAGWASPRWLIYGTAGAAQTKVSYNEVFTDTYANAYEASRESQAKIGLVWGGGAEVKLGKHWSVKGEWLHAHFDKMRGQGSVLTAYTPTRYFPGSSFSHYSDLSVDMARLGINFRF